MLLSFTAGIDDNEYGSVAHLVQITENLIMNSLIESNILRLHDGCMKVDEGILVRKFCEIHKVFVLGFEIKRRLTKFA